MGKNIFGSRPGNALFASMIALREEVGITDDTLMSSIYNNKNPDKLHYEWMIKNGIILPEEAIEKAKVNRWKTPKKQMTVGSRCRSKGWIPTCKKCGKLGHYSKTCKEKF